MLPLGSLEANVFHLERLLVAFAAELVRVDTALDRGELVHDGIMTLAARFAALELNSNSEISFGAYRQGALTDLPEPALAHFVSAANSLDTPLADAMGLLECFDHPEVDAFGEPVK